ncbi:MAG TPA: G1 family glutamic endopeptidase, partial [Candidatus Solibacter sp.]|nr:G1 family glutamic endopeptidase [Candidatus Solibacter sp.]
EAAALSDQDLAARGYPRRPDPKDAKGHATWLKAVTQPMTFVPPNPVATPGISHAPSCCGTPTSSNWSGFQWESTGGFSSQFDYVTGSWLVPHVTGPNNGPRAYSAMWIGLDGFNTFIPGTNQVDLVQAGTEQDALTTRGTTISIPPYAWYQFLPHDPSEIRLTGFNVSAGDQISCSVWIGPAQNLPAALSGQFAWFAFFNLSKNEFTIISEPRTVNVPGLEAEWIMERPTVNGSLPNLADFGTAEMFAATAGWDPTGFAIGLGTPPSTFVNANGAATLPITMMGMGKSAVVPFSPIAFPRATPNPVVIDFVWKAFH